MTSHLVFVFGTLKEGFPNFSKNYGVRVPGFFRTKERFPLLLVGERHSPWMVLEPGNGFNVNGQVFRVDDEALAAMDTLERISEADGYQRQSIVVECVDSSEEAVVWTYLKPPSQLIASQLRAGPLAEYTMEHAAHYRSRVAM